MKTILVADDEPELLRILDEVLTDAGYTVVAAHNGKEAVELALRELPDLLLMDVMMPGLDGREATRQVRAAGLLTTPVILMSAGAALQHLDSGMTFIPKPFSLERLLSLLDQLMPRSD